MVATLATFLHENRRQLAQAWAAEMGSIAAGRIPMDRIERETPELVDGMIAAWETGSRDVAEPAYETVVGLLVELSITQAEVGFSPSETARSVFVLKNKVFELSGEGQGVSGHELLELWSLIDDLGLRTFESFAARREKVISAQAEQVLELSTPVMKVWDGVLALPIVGTLDSKRTQIIMESLLQELSDTGSTHAIIDITGVSAVDTQVAQHLLKTIAAARLMGAECIVSGLRPQIAQTIVTLGIEFGDIVTCATLADALRLKQQSVRTASNGR